METSSRHKDAAIQREFERIGSKTVKTTTVSTPTTNSQGTPSGGQKQQQQVNIQTKLNNVLVCPATVVFDFTDTASITWSVTRYGTRVTIEGTAIGILPDGTEHQTLRNDGDFPKDWEADSRLLNRGFTAHTFDAAKGAVQIDSVTGETGTLLRVNGVAGSNIYGIFADTDNQTAIGAEATGTGYAIWAYGNLGTAIIAESVSNAAIQAIGNAAEGLYATSANGYAVFASSSNNNAIAATSATNWGVQSVGSNPSGTLGTFGGVHGSSATDNGIGVFGRAEGNGGIGVYGEATDPAGLAIQGKTTQNNGYAGSFVATGTNSVGLYVEGTLWGLETTSDIAAGDVHAGEYYSSGVKVVGAQQAAITDATGTLGSATSQLNLVLAALRNHGLIDT